MKDGDVRSRKKNNLLEKDLRWSYPTQKQNVVTVRLQLVTKINPVWSTKVQNSTTNEAINGTRKGAKPTLESLADRDEAEPIDGETWTNLLLNERIQVAFDEDDPVEVDEEWRSVFSLLGVLLYSLVLPTHTFLWYFA